MSLDAKAAPFAPFSVPKWNSGAGYLPLDPGSVPWTGQQEQYPPIPPYPGTESMIDESSYYGTARPSDSMVGPQGTFDASGAWVPPSRMETSGAYYDETGAWVPPQKQEPAGQVKDPGAEFEARVKSILAKAKLQEAVKQVAPKKEPKEVKAPREQPRQDGFNDAPLLSGVRQAPANLDFSYNASSEGFPRIGTPSQQELPHDVCWNFVKNGRCSRGLACPWRHGADETIDMATMRRETILSKLSSGPSVDPSPEWAPRNDPRIMTMGKREPVSVPHLLTRAVGGPAGNLADRPVSPQGPPPGFKAFTPLLGM